MVVMKINEIKAGDKDVELVAEVSAIAEPKEVTTRFGTQLMLTVVTLKDDTGEVEMSLWGKLPEGLAIGKSAEIKGAFVRLFKGKKSLSLMKKGSIKVV
jgi:ssDNA-binding replication factor A large subunit